MLTTTSAPAAAAVGSGPHGNHRSSQMVIATRAIPKDASTTCLPGTK